MNLFKKQVSDLFADGVPAAQEIILFSPVAQEIIAMHRLGKRLYAFTPDKTYILRRLRWYHYSWAWLCGRKIEATYVAELDGV